jgi:hypothetical protein
VFSTSVDMPLRGVFWEQVSASRTERIWFVIISILTANIISWTINFSKLMSSRNYLPLLFSFVFISGLRLSGLNAAHMSGILIMVFLLTLSWKDIGIKPLKASGFDGGLLAGLCFPIAPATLFSSLFLWIRAVYDGIALSAFLLPFIGIITSVFMWWGSCYLIDIDFFEWLQTSVFCSSCSSTSPALGLHSFPFVLLVVLVFPSFLSFVNSSVSRIRQTIGILFWGSVLGVPLFVFVPASGVYFQGAVMIFAAMITAIGLSKWKPSIYRDLMILFAIIAVPIAWGLTKF